MTPCSSKRDHTPLFTIEKVGFGVRLLLPWLLLQLAQAQLWVPTLFYILPSHLLIQAELGSKPGLATWLHVPREFTSCSELQLSNEDSTLNERVIVRRPLHTHKDHSLLPAWAFLHIMWIPCLNSVSRLVSFLYSFAIKFPKIYSWFAFRFFLELLGQFMRS